MGDVKHRGDPRSQSSRKLERSLRSYEAEISRIEDRRRRAAARANPYAPSSGPRLKDFVRRVTDDDALRARKEVLRQHRGFKAEAPGTCHLCGLGFGESEMVAIVGLRQRRVHQRCARIKRNLASWARLLFLIAIPPLGLFLYLWHAAAFAQRRSEATDAYLEVLKKKADQLRAELDQLQSVR